MIQLIKNKYNQFKDWQKCPFEVAPMSDEQHVCATCETEFVGNYCPRCGQSAKIQPKMSLWKTILLFLDIWGLGNRGMFRTLRDLVLRPGYVICDYLNGRRWAYFPPFKMLFLLTTLSVLIGHGFNLNFEDYLGEYKPIVMSGEDDATDFLVLGWLNSIFRFAHDYPSFFELGCMMFFGNFFYLFFRKSKILGTLSYHEIVIASVYMLNMNLLYLCLFRFFGFYHSFLFLLPLLYLIPLKQFSGFGLMKTMFRAFLSLLLGLVSIMFFLTVIYFIATLMTDPQIFFE